MILNDMYCSSCLYEIFPFNSVDNDTEFISIASGSCCTTSLTCLSDKIFMPFELNDLENQFCTFNEDIDPDIQFFNTFNQYVTKCNYLIESSFTEQLKSPRLRKQNFSLLHTNIRSIKKKIVCF